MPSYKNYLITTGLLFCFAGCINTANVEPVKNSKIKKTIIKHKTKSFNLEDPYIMYALEYENQKDYGLAREIYSKLFKNTNNYEYLLKYLNLSYVLKDYSSVKDNASLESIENIKQEEMILKLYTLSLLKLNEKEECIKYAKKLTSKFYHKYNNTFLASIYLDLKEYEKSEEEFKKAYELDKSVNTLQTITNIQYYYTNKKEESKKSMKDYISSNSYPFSLSLQLLSFYEKDKEKDKIIPLLEKMYDSYKKANKEPSLSNTENLLTRYLIKEDSKKAITFLEGNNIKSPSLLPLYRKTKQLEKANILLGDLYKQTDNLEFLAQQAILEFEMAEDKKTVLDSVIAKFDKVLNKISNPVYENYLAYILIDFDLDVKRGLVLVKKALVKEPKNLAYIDTLAWGEYKINDCKNAYKNMKNVIDNAKFEDDEIKLHWEKIKECVK
ncbi:MAG: hypothetical protein ACPG9K_02025 [Poseidonibacter sp.]